MVCLADTHPFSPSLSSSVRASTKTDPHQYWLLEREQEWRFLGDIPPNRFQEILDFSHELLRGGKRCQEPFHRIST
jgi:hypothetical protein